MLNTLTGCYNMNHSFNQVGPVPMLKILLVLLLVFSSPAGARMYQWVDPESGSTQLSGKPPMWYRGTENGPRVFVFENSRVIDDTNIEVSDSEREKLRQQAFLKAEKIMSKYVLS